MAQAVAQADALERLRGLRFIRDAVEVLREHDVFHRGEIGHQVVLLKYKSDLVRPETGELRFAECADVETVHAGDARSLLVETAKNIDECCFARAGRAMMAIHSPADTS